MVGKIETCLLFEIIKFIRSGNFIATILTSNWILFFIKNGNAIFVRLYEFPRHYSYVNSQIIVILFLCLYNTVAPSLPHHFDILNIPMYVRTKTWKMKISKIVTYDYCIERMFIMLYCYWLMDILTKKCTCYKIVYMNFYLTNFIDNDKMSLSVFWIILSWSIKSSITLS